jgi:hypothetical protein
MATWDDVRDITATLPEVEENLSGDGLPGWSVRGKALAWDRPLRKSDLAALGDAAPGGPILCAHVPDVGAKEALLADDPGVYFTTPHFNGYPAILVQLERIAPADLAELLTEAWLARAPKRLAAEFLKSLDPD